MKKIKLLFAAFTAFAFMISCEEEDNLAPLGEWELSEPALESTGSISLDEDDPIEKYEFTWEPAVSSERYQVRYDVIIDTIGSGNDETPIISKVSENGGKSTRVVFNAAELDLALSYAGFEAGNNAEVEMTVIAKSIDKQSLDTQDISISRFETEYKPEQLFISGAATEVGTNLSGALPARALTDSEGNITFIFEAYTHLEAGETFKVFSNNELPAHVYGGSEGNLVKNGSGISVGESGEYRLSFDFENNTYDLMRIEKLSIVGAVIPNGWGGDEPLDYIGNGEWQKEIYLPAAGGFLFRLNEDWGYLFKQVQGTSDELYMESQAETAGINVEDLALAVPGNYTVNVNLQGNTYTYSLIGEEPDTTPPSETPESLYLLSSGEPIIQFEKDENTFNAPNYLSLQAGITYQLNSAEDGSGTVYSLEGLVGETSNPDGDSAFGNVNLVEGGEGFTVARDQAYDLALNFESGSATWKYYNIKLFHWDEANGAWDDRDEFLMTYVHPYQFTLTEDLEAGYHMKFNSPWDIQFGADDPEAMSGTMTNNGGENFVNITNSGSYEVNIEVTDDYATGTYEFISQ